MAQGTLEERVAYLEGKVEEQSRGYRELREDVQQLSARVGALDHKVDRFREELSARVDALDHKVDRFREELSARVDALDHRLSSRMDALDQKLTRQFMWTVALQVSVLLAVVGALAAALFRG